jgi:4-amino-4-deoxy-L-arabinose transferase-like glycosyltransferase
MFQPAEATTKSRLLLMALLLIITAGAALRVIKLGAESFWLDEAYSVNVAHLSLSGIVQEISRDVHPPLYYFALHYWIDLFGDSEFSARLLSAVFGILAIPLLYGIGAVLFDRATGLIAAVFLAWSHFNIEFSQETRMYSLLALLSLASLYCFIRLLKDPRSIAALACYVVCSSLLLYTHVYAVFTIAAENLFVLLLLFTSRKLFRRTFLRWVCGQVLLLLLFAPWLTVLGHQISEHKSFWIAKPTLFELRYTFLQFAGSLPLLFILVPLAVLAIVGLIRREQRKPHGGAPDAKVAGLPLTAREKTSFLLIWLACPVLLPFIASHFITPFYLAKYTIAASPAFLLLAALGLRELPWHQIRLVLLVALIALAQRDIFQYWNKVKKDDWRRALAFFNQTAQPKDLVLFTQPAAHLPFDYYSKPTGLIEEPFPDYNHQLTAANVAELLHPAIENHERVWIVLSHQNDLSPLVPRQMSRWYEVAAHEIRPGVELYLFEQRK